MKKKSRKKTGVVELPPILHLLGFPTPPRLNPGTRSTAEPLPTILNITVENNNID